MEKIINTEKYAKKVYTKSEIRYITEHDWAMVLQTMVPDGCHYTHRGYGRLSPVQDVTCTTREQVAAYKKAFARRAAALRKKMPEHLDEMYATIDANVHAEQKAEQKRQRVHDKIDAILKADGMGGVNATLRELRTGDNTDEFRAKYATTNGIVCHEEEDWNGYSRRYQLPKITRSFYLHIRRGWHLFKVGGLLTFIKGEKIKREGMACEWIEQGRRIADIRTVTGYLVRGEHIEAGSLKEAQAINAEHRAKQLTRIRAARKRQERRNDLVERRKEQMTNGTLRITFRDSLNAGNCRPGTSEFKRRYEAAIGHEAKDISIADLRKYGKQFGVEYYAEKAIQYVLNH